MVMTVDPPRLTDSKQSKSALHVEDDRIWQRMIGGYLQEAGYDVTQVDNLQDAKSHVQRQRFDLYVVDGSFPSRQGQGPSPDTGVKLYNLVRKQNVGASNFVFVSGDVELEMLCREKNIRFMNKSRFDYGSFMAYLESPQ